MADLSLGTWTPEMPSWNAGVKAMQPSDAMAALEAATARATNASSYSSQRPPSKMDSILAALDGVSANSANAQPAGFVKTPEPLSAIAAKAPGQMASYATGGLAMDALASMAGMAALMPQGMGGGQQPMMSQGAPASAMPAISGPLYAADGAYVGGEGTGVSDDVDAKLSRGEFVIPADVVSGLGKGSSDAGADYLRNLCSQVRAMHIRNTQQMPEPR